MEQAEERVEAVVPVHRNHFVSDEIGYGVCVIPSGQRGLRCSKKSCGDRAGHMPAERRSPIGQPGIGGPQYPASGWRERVAARELQAHLHTRHGNRSEYSAASQPIEMFRVESASRTSVDVMVVNPDSICRAATSSTIRCSASSASAIGNLRDPRSSIRLYAERLQRRPRPLASVGSVYTPKATRVRAHRS